ncbi:MAG: PAS domain-containing sensor histidine kinase [Candidatus Hodarchaeales archaeon]
MFSELKPLSDILDKIPAGIVILDRFNNNEPVYVNKKARNDLKIENDQNLSKNVFLQFLDPSERTKFLEISSSGLQLPEISEWKSLTLSGKPTWVQLRITPFYDYYMVIIRNIGKIKQSLAKISSTEAQYQALIERDPNFLFILENGVINYYNNAFIEKLGYSAEEIEKYEKMPTYFVVPEHRGKIARFLLQSKRKIMTELNTEEKEGDIERDQYRKPDETTEFDLLCKDGSQIPVHAIVKRVYTNKDVIIQGVLIDLSSLKELQEKKLDFLTLTQHHLRTPLSTLKGYFDFYIKRIKEGVSQDEKEELETKFLDVFQRNIDRMVSLSNELNDISLIRHGKMKCVLRGEDFTPILRKAIEDLDFLLRQYRIDLIVDYPSIPLVVNLDRNRIYQSLRNIIENAIKFTGHGIVEIKLSVLKGNKTLQLTIKDNGVGIDLENLDDVTKPFMTFHPSASRLGLGLYLTKEIILTHNGTFKINSDGFNKGTTVIITLPLLISLNGDLSISEATTNSELNELIKLATTSEEMLDRRNAIKQLEYGKYLDTELEQVIKTLEQIILYDNEKLIRNLAGKVYSQKIEKRDKANSNVSYQ